MEITVVHWNVWYRQDVRQLPELLRTLDADVLCLCELTMDHDAQVVSDGAAWIGEQLGLHVEAMRLPLTADADRPPSMVNAVLTRMPVLSSRRVLLNEPDGSGGYQDEYRGYVEVQLNTPDGPLNVGATHLSYAHRFADTARKVGEAQRVAATVSRQRTVVCGDFNTTPDTRSYSVLTEHLQRAGVPEPTWTTKPFSYDGFVENELRWPLDAVLTTPDVEVRSCEVIQTELSDHLPLRAVIEV